MIPLQGTMKLISLNYENCWKWKRDPLNQIFFTLKLNQKQEFVDREKEKVLWMNECIKQARLHMLYLSPVAAYDRSRDNFVYVLFLIDDSFQIYCRNYYWRNLRNMLRGSWNLNILGDINSNLKFAPAYLFRMWKKEINPSYPKTKCLFELQLFLYGSTKWMYIVQYFINHQFLLMSDFHLVVSLIYSRKHFVKEYRYLNQ